MTKIAILSDIHGNSDALAKVLDEARLQGAERLIVCGDIIGYYYDTSGVWNLLSQWQTDMCRGNHEKIFEEWLDGDREKKDTIQRKYGSSYKIAEKSMNPDDIRHLLSLKHPVHVNVDGVSFLVSHGAPWDEDAYIYPDANESNVKRLVEYSNECDVLLLGHTHYQAVWEREGFLALNPGSVGQPRSGKASPVSDVARAQWALYDTITRKHVFMNSIYNPSAVLDQTSRFDPDLAYLRTVLTRQEGSA